jgi:hypothetical protein
VSDRTCKCDHVRASHAFAIAECRECDCTLWRPQPEPNCLCGHVGWRHVSDKFRCRKPGCGCTRYRTEEAA